MSHYYCKECGTQAVKPPCVKQFDPDRPLVTSKATLGTWGCPNCGKHVRVRREGAVQKKKVA